MKILTITVSFFFVLISFQAFTQNISINSTGDTPDASAMLDVTSTEKGMLIPRMTQTERDAILNPANGLMIFQTNNMVGLYYFDGSNWRATGYESLSIGDLANAKNTGGSLFVGSLAGLNDDGTNNLNVGIGNIVMPGNFTGEKNIAIGYSAMAQNASGDNNTGIGFEANYWNQNGSNNTIIGYQAGKGGSAHDKSGHVFLGYQAGFYEGGQNKLYVENSGSDSPLIYGEFDNDLLRINGTLDVNNAFQFPTNDGNDGQILRTDGNGSLSWSESFGDFSNGGEAGAADRSLGNTDNYALSFKTNNTERVKLFNDGGIRFDGNIGIFTDPNVSSSINKSIDLYASGTFSNPYLKISGHNSAKIRLESRRLSTTSGKDWQLISGGGSTGVLDRFTIYNADDGYVFNIRDGGKVGIGTDTPETDLQISGNDGLLVNGGTLTDGTAQDLGAGQRMHFYPKKAAFRAGEATTTEWNDGNIGDHSIAMGYETKASGTRSVALGNHTLASAGSSTALGYFTIASGGYASIATGYWTVASGNSGTATGSETMASGDNSLSTGKSTIASGNNSAAFGKLTTASGQYAIATGRGIEAAGEYTFGVALSDQTGTVINQSNTLSIMGGKVGIGATIPTAILDVNGTNGYDQFRLRTSYTPTGTADTNGSEGDVSWDDDYIYIKTSLGWKRAALSTW